MDTEFEDLLAGAGGFVRGLTGKKEEKKPKKLNLTPFFLIGGALVVIVVVALVFKRGK